MTETATMKMNRLAPWFGADLAIAEQAAELIGKRAWVGVPFCGGCSIIPFIQTRSGLCGDLHRHIINLAQVIRDPDTWEDLEDRLHGTLFHPDELLAAQRRCLERQSRMVGSLFEQAWLPEEQTSADRVAWAADYFVACWMGRGGHAGKGSEFTQGLAVRYTSSGGDSARRFRSAVESIEAWSMSLRDWQFQCIDVFEFLDAVKDDPNHALYIDAPWPELGEDYAHSFDTTKQIRLRDRLEALKAIRIVVRFGVHGLIESLYNKPCWTWHRQSSRNQSNNTVSEALIVKGGA